ncbi:MAG: hypothetical protein SF052_12375 [Bacteroidia bacterium]|nr:hypothetical protein [Bacteroidia bacterium]
MKKLTIIYSIGVFILAGLPGSYCQPTEKFSAVPPTRDELSDSTKLIHSLYQGKLLIPTQETKGFQSKKITLLQNNLHIVSNIFRLDTLTLSVNYLFKEREGVPQEEFPFEYSAAYVGGWIQVNDLVFEFDSISCLNDTRYSPAMVLWEEEFRGSNVKYYKVGNNSVILFSGFNFACNGSHCSSYTVMSVQISGTEINVNAISYPGLYPFDFSNTFLFRNSANGNLNIWGVKKGVGSLKNTDDFEEITLLKR